MQSDSHLKKFEQVSTRHIISDVSKVNILEYTIISLNMLAFRKHIYMETILFQKVNIKCIRRTRSTVKT